MCAFANDDYPEAEKLLSQIPARQRKLSIDFSLLVVKKLSDRRHIDKDCHSLLEELLDDGFKFDLSDCLDLDEEYSLAKACDGCEHLLKRIRQINSNFKKPKKPRKPRTTKKATKPKTTK